jgi:arsenate reductase
MAESTAPVRIAFVCVRNAGRSQMATAFAERERADRGLEDRVEIHTGGTRPADEIHGVVVEAMAEIGDDVADRTPQEITPDARNCDYVITMGCSAEEVCPVGWAGEGRDWDLENPDGKDLDRVRAIREAVRQQVSSLFDEIEGA